MGIDHGDVWKEDCLRSEMGIILRQKSKARR